MSTDNSFNFEYWVVCKSPTLFPVQGNFKLHKPSINFACCKAFVQDLNNNEKIGDFFDILQKQIVGLLLHNDGPELRVGEAGLAAGDRKLSRKRMSKAFDAPSAHGNAHHRRLPAGAKATRPVGPAALADKNEASVREMM